MKKFFFCILLILTFSNGSAFTSHLQVGNKFYLKIISFGVSYGTFPIVVQRDTVIGNKKYYVVDNNMAGGITLDRIDTINAKWYRRSLGASEECLYIDFNFPIDTIPPPACLSGLFFRVFDKGTSSGFLGDPSSLQYIRIQNSTIDEYAYREKFGFTFRRGDYNYVWTMVGAIVNGVTYGTVGVEQTSSEVPLKYYLSQNYPNPFNPSTTIKFDITSSSNLKLVIYNYLGKEVETLVNEQLKPGSYKYDFNGADLASGVYLYTLQTSDFISTKKMLLIK